MKNENKKHIYDTIAILKDIESALSSIIEDEEKDSKTHSKRESALLSEVEEIRSKLDKTLHDEEELMTYNESLREDIKKLEIEKVEAYDKIMELEAKIRESRKYRTESETRLNEPKKGFRIKED